MNLYKEYKVKKHPDDDFLRWVLIRKFNIKQQLLVITILWFLWALAAPNLKFWVFFFEAVLVYCLIAIPIEFIFKKINQRKIN